MRESLSKVKESLRTLLESGNQRLSIATVFDDFLYVFMVEKLDVKELPFVRKKQDETLKVCSETT